MEPITGAVVAIVLWFVLLFACWSLPAIFAIVGSWAGSLFDKVWEDFGFATGGVIGAIVGWIAALTLTVFSLIQGVLEVIHLFDLLA